jgi:hypothetical protein
MRTLCERMPEEDKDSVPLGAAGFAPSELQSPPAWH